MRSLWLQLHAIWYDIPAHVDFSEAFLRLCLPLDDSREFLETEKEFCRSLKEDSEHQLNKLLTSLGFDKSHSSAGSHLYEA